MSDGHSGDRIMSVSTYLELYLTLYGWILYDGFWDIITDTGIAYLPFIGMFLRNIVEPIKSQDAKDASTTSLRRIEIDIIIMFTVVVLAVQPVMTINSTSLGYTKSCTTTEVNAGSTGTTYDNSNVFASLGSTTAKIPLWWYGVLAITGGFNDAAIMAIPCGGTDIRLVSFKLDNSRITDPHVRRQVQLFYKDCYNSVMTIHMNQGLSSAYPEEDLQWLGSKTFLDDLYNKKHASVEIKGFTYNASRDAGYYDPRIYPASPPVPYGRPTCKQWWEGTGSGTVANSGLRDQLKAQIDPSILTEFKAALGGPAVTAETLAIRKLVTREEPYFNGLRDLDAYNDTVADKGISAVALVGSIIGSAAYYPAMYMVKAAAPVIQATMLMMIYMLLPFFFVFSSYNIGKIIFMSIIIFSVKFWTVLWAIAHWLDNNLIDALIPSFLASLTGGADSLLMRFVVGFVITGLFVSMPIFWSGLLTWAGHRVGSQINNSAEKMSSGANSAGEKGGGVVSGGAKAGVKKTLK